MLDIIRERRSIRRYKSIPIPWKKIMEIVDAARYAPTLGNLQNFQIVYVDDPEKLDALSNTTEQDWTKSVKGMLVVCVDYDIAKQHYPENAKEWTDQSIGAVIENMLLEATNQGLGSCWVGSFDKEKVKKILSIKTEPIAIITLGYSNEIPEEKTMKDFPEFFFYNKFGQPLFDVREKYQSPRVLEGIENKTKKIKHVIKKSLEKIKKSVLK